MKARSLSQVIAILLAFPSLLVSQARVSNVSTLGFFADTLARRTPWSAGGVRALVTALEGKWRFEVFSPNQTAPIASGQREMRLLDDSTKLAWTETSIGQSSVGNGVLGYNYATGAWYVVGAYTHEPNPVVLVGRADSSGHVLVLDPVEVTSRPGAFISSELRIVDTNQLEWVASDGRWRILFTRIGRS